MGRSRSVALDLKSNQSSDINSTGSPSIRDKRRYTRACGNRPRVIRAGEHGMKGFSLWLIILATATCGDAQVICVRHLIVPGYPRLARSARLQGSVSVEITIDAEGKVVSAKASGASKLLQRAAEQNLLQWIFYPTRAPAGSSPTRSTMTFVYRLEGKEEYYDPPPRIIMDLPSHVDIVSNPPEPQP